MVKRKIPSRGLPLTNGTTCQTSAMLPRRVLEVMSPLENVVVDEGYWCVPLQEHTLIHVNKHPRAQNTTPLHYLVRL